MGNSIRFRLWSAATISILVALAIAGVGLRYLFELNVERRIVGELTADLNELIGATSFAANGQLSVAPGLTDPRFTNPLSGHYWQVEDLASHGLVRSRSLWDAKLALPGQGASGELRTIEELKGPGDELTVAVEVALAAAGHDPRARQVDRSRQQRECVPREAQRASGEVRHLVRVSDQ